MLILIFLRIYVSRFFGSWWNCIFYVFKFFLEAEMVSNLWLIVDYFVLRCYPFWDVIFRKLLLFLLHISFRIYEIQLLLRFYTTFMMCFQIDIQDGYVWPIWRMRKIRVSRIYAWRFFVDIVFVKCLFLQIWAFDIFQKD